MEARVKAPSLPINIIRIIKSLLKFPSSGVIPVESPTVPKADVTSNISWIKLYPGSNMQSSNVPPHTTSRDRNAII